MRRLMIVAAMVLGMSGMALAQETAPATRESAHVGSSNQPVLPERAVWAGSMVIVVIAMFIAAAGIGVVVRLNMPEQPPEPVHHDDHGHGDDGHGQDAHGHGGGHGHGH